jgi:hypothetical protein
MTVRRSYSNTAVVTTETGLATGVGTTLTLASATGWPTTANGPFTAVVEPGTANAEIILVGARTTTALSSITRGYGGTTAVTHASGSVIAHEVDATDMDEANALTADVPDRPVTTLNTWVTMTPLTNSWVTAALAGYTAAPGYYVNAMGIVQFRGQIKSGTGGVSAFTMPAGLRPAANKLFACGGNNNPGDVYARLVVQSNGQVIPGTTWPGFISLDGVSYLAEV